MPNSNLPLAFTLSMTRLTSRICPFWFCVDTPDQGINKDGLIALAPALKQMKWATTFDLSGNSVIKYKRISYNMFANSWMIE